MSFTSKLVPSVELTKGSATYTLKVGDTIESITYSSAYEDVTLEMVTLVGLELGAIHSKNIYGRIYDGVPVNQFHSDNLGNFRNASEYYTVTNLMVQTIPTDEGDDEIVETEPVLYRIPVDKLVAIGGTFTNADGSQTTTVDPSEEGASVATKVSEVPEGSTVVVGAGEVAEPLTLDKGVTIAGENAGVAQNFDQEV